MPDPFSSLLERIAAGEAFSEVMAALIDAIETEIGGAVGVLLWREAGERWRLVAAPRLGPEGARALDGTQAIEISPDDDGCDLAADPRWAGYRSLLRAHGFAGGWAHPVRSRRGESLGALLLLGQRAAWQPTAAERGVIARGAALAGLGFERQQNERTRAVELEHLRLLAPAVADAFWEWEVASDRLRWDDGVQRHLGLAPAEAGGTLAERHARIDPADRERVARSFKAFLEGSAATWESEYRMRRGDGRHADVVEHARALRGGDGRPLRVVGAIKDVTARQQAAFDERRRQRMETVKSVSGGIAHDLNNLLAPILMGVELLKQNPLEERVAKMVSVIERSAQRGAGLVRQVRSFARGIEGNRAAVDLGAVLEAVAKAVAESLPSHVAFDLRIPEPLWIVHGDAVNLHQLFTNLCANARDAMAASGGALTVTAENRTLDRQSLPPHAHVTPGRFVAVAVMDRGVGVPRGMIDRIFEPFFTTKEQVKGAGMGLATVSGILDAHGGFITVRSEPGQGSEFTAYLPVDAVPALDEPDGSSVAALHHSRGETVLLVDDESAILGIATQALESFGYNVKAASHGAEAVSVYIAHRAQIRVAVVDLLMPVMDGPATIAALREIDPKLKVIATSGHDGERVMARARAAGVREFLLKPYTAESLLAQVQKALAR